MKRAKQRMQRRDAQLPMLMERYASIEKGAIVERMTGQDMVFPMSLASEYPVQRWFGTEMLSMEPGAIRLGRLNDGASVLFNHNIDEIRGSHIPGSGMVGPDRVLRAQIKLTAATQAGRDAIGLVEGGHLTKVSVGYRMHKVVEQTKAGKKRTIDGATFERVIGATLKTRGQDALTFRSLLDKEVGAFDRGEEGDTVYNVTDWEPYESSLVTTPADPTVGVGRSEQVAPARESAAATMARAEGVVMTTEVEVKPAAASIVAESELKAQSAVAYETSRKTAILNLVKANKLDERIGSFWIQSGASMEVVSKEILDILEERSKNQPQQSLAHIGMEAKDVRRYSVWRALNAVTSGDWSEAQLELEASREVAKKTNRQNGRMGFFVPLDIQMRQLATPLTKRAGMLVGTDAQGGFLRDVENIGFIELLRNRSVLFNMGARRMSGLVGNVTIPKQTVGATAYWLSTEATAITEADQTLAQVALTPRTVGAYTTISRLLQLQSSPDAEALIMSDLAQQVALAVDLAGIAGTGTEQPTGILGTANVGGFTGTSLAAAGVLDAQADVAAANALTASCGYVFTPAVAALLMQRPELATTGIERLWKGNILDGTLFGFKAMSSNQMPTAKGIFGDFGQVIVGEWGVLELAVNPTANFPAGITGLRAMYTVDIAVRYAGAFSITSSVT